jgi:acyl-CoA synthetase (AMP-forming)/AMP-acid ligase II
MISRLSKRKKQFELTYPFYLGSNRNIINNAWFIGANMALSPADTIVCPPPLFHCFGITMALLAAIGHGSTIVFPSDRFNATETVDAVLREKATALLGVPTMFLAELEVLQATRNKIDTVRTGIIAGTSVPAPLMQRLKEEMGIDGLLIAYGMTETSPVTFMTALSDPYPKRVSTLGKVMPHTGVKVIDQHGNIVPRNQRGEICTSGYALMKGYYQEEDKTREAMRTDSHGTVWIHTGDEGFIDEDGYGHITGRIKDLIIRGGYLL